MQGDLLKFTGEERWVGEEGDWVPVRREDQKESTPSSCVSPVEVVLPLSETGLEVVPGLWSADQAEGLIYLTLKEQELTFVKGTRLVWLQEQWQSSSFADHAVILTQLPALEVKEAVSIACA